MTKKNSYNHVGAWLVVDEVNKKVKYQVDPSWLEDVSEDEQKIIFAKLKILATAYKRAGFSLFDFVKKNKN